ncbi:hypothetical protein [Gorillibacterium sp. sgz5001074]|uniref:hypothetical protein n=1 Tax=Gorillibacterium sp. sgz5001074 TaxID=3446695 RepID=UPI003F66D3F0
MMEDIYKVFSEIEEQAINILRKEQFDVGFARLFQIIVLTSFSENISYEFFKSVNDESEYSIIISVWNKEEDLQILEKPLELLKYRNKKSQLPQIKTYKFTFKANIINNFLGFLRTERICIFPNVGMIGVDGTQYELIIGSGLNQITVAWWEEGPLEWNELIQQVNAIIEFAEEKRSEH